MITFLEAYGICCLFSQIPQLNIGVRQLIVSIILGLSGVIVAVWIFRRQYDISLEQVNINKEQQALSSRQLEMDKRVFEIETVRYNLNEFRVAIEDRQTKCFKMEDTLRNSMVSQEMKDSYNELTAQYVKEIIEYIDYKDKLQLYYNDCLARNPGEFTYKPLDEVLHIENLHSKIIDGLS